MQKDSTMPCFAAYGEQTATTLRDRFQPQLAHSAVDEFAEKLIMTSLGSSWTRLYDSVSALPTEGQTDSLSATSRAVPILQSRGALVYTIPHRIMLKCGTSMSLVVQSVYSGTRET